VNILLPSGIASPRAVLFNYDWITLVVVVVILLIGAVYYVLGRPATRIEMPAAEARSA
jgi:hypothetical protein